MIFANRGSLGVLDLIGPPEFRDIPGLLDCLDLLAPLNLPSQSLH